MDIIQEAIKKGFVLKNNKYYQTDMLEWLRDTHKIHVNAYPNSDNEGEDKEVWFYTYICRYDNCLLDEAFNCIDDTPFDSYKQAIDEALKVIILDILDD